MNGLDIFQRRLRPDELEQALTQEQGQPIVVPEDIQQPSLMESEQVQDMEEQIPPMREPAQAPIVETKPKELTLMEQLEALKSQSDQEIKSARTMDEYSALVNAMAPYLQGFSRAKSIKAAKSLGGDPGMVQAPGLPTSRAKDLMGDRKAKIEELLTQQKIAAAGQPKQLSDLDKAKIESETAKAKMFQAKAEQSGKQQPSSVFEKKKMEKLAAAGVDYITKDRDQYLNNINKIDNAIDILNKDNVMTSGRIVGRLPDFARTESSITARENIQSAIQETLRPTLGAQFTEKEGERIMNLQYNENLDEAENKKRAQELKRFIEKKVKFSDDLYSYIEEKGSDKGFPYEKYGMKKSESSMSAQEPGSGKQIARKQYSPSRNQTKIIYADGTEEIVDGKQ